MCPTVPFATPFRMLTKISKRTLRRRVQRGLRTRSQAITENMRKRLGPKTAFYAIARLSHAVTTCANSAFTRSAKHGRNSLSLLGSD
ncbi:hypothetical protein SprV_0401413000 [Sparganum proliferum]